MNLALIFALLTSAISSGQARIPRRELYDVGDSQTQNETFMEVYSYFVQAEDEWTANNTKIIQDAGGEVFLNHAKTGMALVTSTDPDFLININASFAFSAEDETFEFGLEDGVDEQAITPGDETFFPYQWNMMAINAPDAWKSGCSGAGARVAVIDGGISSNHLDIKPNLDTQCSFSTVSGKKYDQDSAGFRHATHVAGIIAAADNKQGTIGVAPSAKIMAIKALHNGSGSFGAVIMAILFAADPQSFGGACKKQADIINMSLGAIERKRILQGFQSSLLKAMNFATSQGVLVISSAGNDGLDLGQSKDYVVIPGTLGTGISISATGPVGFANGATNFRRIASYTNYGESLIYLAAPGGDFVYPYENRHMDMVLSPSHVSGTKHSYSWAAGTSMAAPHVAGVAALIKGANPDISLGQLKSMLKNTADDEGKTGNDEFYGHGFVNAYRACTE